MDKYGDVFEELPLTTARGPLSTVPVRAEEGVDAQPTKVCTVPNCTAKHYGVGLCHGHYSRQRRHGDAVAEVPLGAGDAELVRALAARQKLVRLCSVQGCGRRHHGAGLCITHYQRKVRTGYVAPEVPVSHTPGAVAKAVAARTGGVAR